MSNIRKVEAIIYGGNEIFIQDITFLIPRYQESPILRIPSVEEIKKIEKACKKSMSMYKENSKSSTARLIVY